VISSLKVLLLLFVVVVALKLDHSFTISYPRLDLIMTMRPHSCTSFDYDNFAVSILEIHSLFTSVINFFNCGLFLIAYIDTVIIWSRILLRCFAVCRVIEGGDIKSTVR